MNALEKNKAAAAIVREIRRLSRPVRLMEVCGTHTNVIFASGLRSLLPPEIQLISGPGCPVCVTARQYLDKAIAYAQMPGVAIATFGDMLKVPGSITSLAAVKTAGADVRVIYSPLDAVTTAAANPRLKVIFLAVGFETTAPATAAALLVAAEAELSNFFILSAHKQVLPALKALLRLSVKNLDGFLLPGHVCMITGLKHFAGFPAESKRPSVVAGFEPLNILLAICMLLEQLSRGEIKLENAYPAVVREDGNQTALKILSSVFESSDQTWRGLGLIRNSGLTLRQEYRSFDAELALPVSTVESSEADGCRCGDVICGFAEPPDCPHFGASCSPLNPIGACMVSSEGACSAWYKYSQGRWKV